MHFFFWETKVLKPFPFLHSKFLCCTARNFISEALSGKRGRDRGLNLTARTTQKPRKEHYGFFYGKGWMMA